MSTPYSSASTILNRLLARTRLKQLHIIVMAAEIGSTQGVAEQLGVSQSAASKAITDLEALIETPLFLRHGRGITPTSACIDILPLLRSTIRSLELLAQSVAENRSHSGGILRIGAVMSGIPGGLGTLLPRFSELFPHLRVEVEEGVIGVLISRYTAGELDVVITRRPFQIPAGSGFVPLWKDSYHIVARTDHPLTRTTGLTLADVSTQQWVLGPLNTRMRQVFERIFRRDALPSLTPISTASLPFLTAYLQNSSAVAILPGSVAKPLSYSGLVGILPVKIDLPIEEIGVLFPKDDPKYLTTLLVQFLTNHQGDGLLDPIDRLD